MVLVCSGFAPCAAVQAQVRMPDCEALAAEAGRESGLPEGLLPAIARIESGYKGRAWPWTLNQGGDGSFHPSKDAALARLAEILASGVQNVDLGCMQLNWRWHSDQFDSAAQMMDPLANTRYAAHFLLTLKEQHGSWDAAIGAYHSTQPERSAAYTKKVRKALDKIIAEDQGGAATFARLPEPDAAGFAPLAVTAAPVTRGLLALSGRPLVVASGAGMLAKAEGRGMLSMSPGRSLVSVGN
ncbi:lytic transglycosylase domain-containing protein [Rhodobacter sp. ETT8]|uniref:Lytic transglycosylase domain-containing protein n=2 Tax=Pseudotabrizicola algicola TaxID=2709381 RepID=A0A6B3RJA1_9RHOB|nr:lytic transglycosylase domain-containing protein [Pseudotabrizicola algicola]